MQYYQKKWAQSSAILPVSISLTAVSTIFFNVTRCFRRAEGCLLHGHWRIENFCAFPPIPEVMWKFADVKWSERLTLADVSPLVTVSTPLPDDVDV